MYIREKKRDTVYAVHS